MRPPGFEPGREAWKASMIPLHYGRQAGGPGGGPPESSLAGAMGCSIFNVLSSRGFILGKPHRSTSRVDRPRNETVRSRLKTCKDDVGGWARRSGEGAI